MSARLAILLLALLLAVPLTLPPAARATSIGDPAFQRTWARTDQPVGADKVARTWMWGPEPFSHAFQEPYVDAGSGTRLVQYFDKSRMELTYPGIDPASPWAVTNGLLVVEMVTGNLQRGERSFAPLQPAQAPVAGDPDDSGGPTYATFGTLAFKAPLADGAPIDQRVTRDGVITSDATLAAYGVTAAQRIHVDQIDHQVASVFWEYLHSSGLIFEDDAYHTGQLFEPWYYATGYPIAEAYWATVRVGGTPHDVLMQCFERRCLTYTPGNPAGWQVEAGNVGRHYYQWRYGDAEPGSRYDYATRIGTSGIWDDAPRMPIDLVVNHDGVAYVLDWAPPGVSLYSDDGSLLTRWGVAGGEPGQFSYPSAIAADGDENLYITEAYARRVQKFDHDGAFLLQWRIPDAEFLTDIAVASDGVVYVADERGVVRRFDPQGAPLS